MKTLQAKLRIYADNKGLEKEHQLRSYRSERQNAKN